MPGSAVTSSSGAAIIGDQRATRGGAGNIRATGEGQGRRERGRGGGRGAGAEGEGQGQGERAEGGGQHQREVDTQNRAWLEQEPEFGGVPRMGARVRGQRDQRQAARVETGFGAEAGTEAQGQSNG